MWYVIQVQTGNEETVRIQCEKCISTEILERCVIPRCERMRRYRGEWHKELRILFPGYIFLVSEDETGLFFALKNIIGLTKLIGTGKEIVALTEQEVKLIKKLAGEDDLVELSRGIIEGEKIIITDGPLAGMEGYIKKIDRHKRLAYLEIPMVGRPVETQVGLEIVAKR